MHQNTPNLNSNIYFEPPGLLGGEITKSLGNIYSQDVPTGRPGTSLYDVLQSFFKYSN